VTLSSGKQAHPLFTRPSDRRVDATLRLPAPGLLKVRDYASVPSASRDATQEGIGEAVGPYRSYVSTSLKTLVAEGLVAPRFAHVTGHKRRVKAYALTATGRLRARGLREALAPALPDDGAIREVERSLEMARRLRDREGEARALNNLGIIRMERGDLRESARLFAQTLEICEALGDLRTLSILHGNLGDASRLLGSPDARRHYERSRALAGSLSFVEQLAEIHLSMASAASGEERLVNLDRALALFRRLGAREGVARVEAALRPRSWTPAAPSRVPISLKYTGHLNAPWPAGRCRSSSPSRSARRCSASFPGSRPRCGARTPGSTGRSPPN
jgi:DNA-binding PadR family transcriptional regulator